MAPIRRYLRITKYSVLECRIYLDNPALAESWLLNARNPILPQVIESVRPLVLPKLREENERSKGKGSKKKAVKDIVVEEDFEVSIFLTETSTRHSLLTKMKHFKESNKKSIQSNSSKLMGATNDTAIEVEDRDDNEDDPINLDDLPEIDDDTGSGSDTNSLFVDESRPKRSKRPRASTNVDSTSSDEPAAKRARDCDGLADDDDDDDDEPEEKKKMAMDTTYDGFAIYGRVLCLIVKRKDKKAKPAGLGAGQTLEQWMTSTQIPPEEAEDP